jgi:hypothetical protein
MRSTERFSNPAQRPVVERLHAEREAVHAARAQRPEVRLVHLARIGLDGDLEAVRRRIAEGGASGVEHAAERVRAPQAGRAAAEVHRGERRGPREPAAPGGDLGHGGVGVAVVRDLAARVDCEVAVRTARAAEWEVHVDAEREARPERAGAGAGVGAGRERRRSRERRRHGARFITRGGRGIERALDLLDGYT